jgi:hypothetical protein
MLISMHHDNMKTTVIAWKIHHDVVEFGKTD